MRTLLRLRDFLGPLVLTLAGTVAFAGEDPPAAREQDPPAARDADWKPLPLVPVRKVTCDCEVTGRCACGAACVCPACVPCVPPATKKATDGGPDWCAKGGYWYRELPRADPVIGPYGLGLGGVPMRFSYGLPGPRMGNFGGGRGCSGGS